jgi:tetratricopeptide (TPR) repeat protein
MAMYEKGLELDPLSAVIRSNITYNLAAMGRFDKARKSIERNIEMHPDESFGYGRYAGFQAGVLGRMDDALVWQSKAIQVDPSNATNMSIMAFNYLSLGDFETAEKWIDRAAVAQPHNRMQKIARLYLLLYRDEPEFIAMRAKIAADMAEQLERVRELEASGEILWPENPVETSSLESDPDRL